MTRVAHVLIVAAVVALGSISTAQSQDSVPVKKFLTKDGKRPTGMFANGLMVGKTVYVAGKGDYKPDEPLAGKVENCLNEVKKALAEAGLDMRHVVKSFVYLEDHDTFAEFNVHYAKAFPNEPPAR